MPREKLDEACAGFGAQDALRCGAIVARDRLSQEVRATHGPFVAHRNGPMLQ
jgi:phosphoribosylformylglycinamidine (FGAM) synthase-like amidotransferase family enzyme